MRRRSGPEAAAPKGRPLCIRVEGAEESIEPAPADIEGFGRMWLIYSLDRVGPFKPQVVPFRDLREHGHFATRSPGRPNAIDPSTVRLLSHEARRLCVAGIDILDNTPLLDLKPYVPAFDAHVGSKAGWVDASGSIVALPGARGLPRCGVPFRGPGHLRPFPGPSP